MRRRLPRIPPLSLDGAVRLEARGVSVTYGPWPILTDIDLAVRAGEVLCLVGPNGAGKSTLLGVLSGDIVPASGRVLVDGAPLDAWTHRELALHRAVMLQSIGVTFPFTVTQVVRMGRAPWTGTDAEQWDDDVVARAIVDADLATFTERVYSSLSGGERARAALARTLAQEPVVLLLDEPTAALDLRHQEMAFSLARERAARGDAVVMVLHDLALAAAYADVIVVLQHGRIAAVGPPVDVLSAELLSTVYDHPIEVLRHPRTGALVVLPERDISSRPAGHSPAAASIPELSDSPDIFRRSEP